MLTPGVVSDSSGFGSLSFRGITSLQNNNTIDGGDNNQAFFADERGRNRIGYSTPKAAVEEFQVNTSNYSAEYGRSAGGVINTVTKSGTNSYHGETYFYDRDNGWGAANAFTKISTVDPATGVFTSHNFKPKDWRKITGFGIGGPIIKDKLFFFLSFDYFKRNFPCAARKCSTIGPKASAGRKFSAPISNTVPNSNTTNVPPVTGNVPELAGAIFFCTSEPASAMIGTIIRKRPMSIAIPSVVLYHGVFAVRPAKALPLLPVPELKA